MKTEYGHVVLRRIHSRWFKGWLAFEDNVQVCRIPWCGDEQRYKSWGNSSIEMEEIESYELGEPIELRNVMAFRDVWAHLVALKRSGGFLKSRCPTGFELYRTDTGWRVLRRTLQGPVTLCLVRAVKSEAIVVAHWIHWTGKLPPHRALINLKIPESEQSIMRKICGGVELDSVWLKALFELAADVHEGHRRKV